MKKTLTLSLLALAFSSAVMASESAHEGGEAVIAAQNAELEKNTDGKGSSEVWRLFLYAMLLFLIAEAILCLNPKAPRVPQATGAPSRG